MNGNLVIEYHAIITWLIVACLIFILTAAVGTYISERIKKKMNPVKVPLHGTKEVCGNCPALESFKNDIPRILKKQENRDKVLTNFETCFTKIDVSITSLDDRVKKLFGMIEKTWQDEIQQLRQALRDKNFEIEKLKNKNEPD